MPGPHAPATGDLLNRRGEDEEVDPKVGRCLEAGDLAPLVDPAVDPETLCAAQHGAMNFALGDDQFDIVAGFALGAKASQCHAGPASVETLAGNGRGGSGGDAALSFLAALGEASRGRG